MARQRLKTDLHLHSNFSDGRLSIADLVDLHGQNGFDTIAITDHLCEDNNLIGQVSHRFNWSLNEKTFVEYQREIQRQKVRAWNQYGMNLIFGYEITKNSFANNRSCHLLILGIEDWISPNLEVDEILNQVQRHQGIAIAAHPFHTGEFEFQSFYLWSRQEQLKNKIDAWEVSTRKKIAPKILASHLPLIAASDFHHIGHYDSWKSWILAENSIAGIKHALKQRHVDFFLDQLPTTWAAAGQALHRQDKQFQQR